jgi:molybdopterin-guanine dinucleotide biosynthesis protein A
MHPSENTITGIVLAGGKSSRMGYDKGLSLLEGKKMIECVIQTLKLVTDQILIVANSPAYNDLGYPVHTDLYTNKGPVGGIYTGLYHSSTKDNLIVACDMPFVSTDLLRLILKHAVNKQIVIPSMNDLLEPLCGYYNKDILGHLKDLIELDVLPAHTVVTHFDLKIVPIVDESIVKKRVFTNINKPEDLENIL